MIDCGQVVIPILKISVINDLYSTNIFSTFNLAKHIKRLNIDNDLNNGVDEAGWKTKGDDISVATEVVSNVTRTRIGVIFTPPPSTKEPDKKLCLQAQRWFQKMQEVD